MESTKPSSMTEAEKESGRCPHVLVAYWNSLNVLAKSALSRSHLESWSVLLVIATLAGAVFLFISVRRGQAAGALAEIHWRARAAPVGEQPGTIGLASTRHLKIAHVRNQLESMFSREGVDADWTERTRKLVGSAAGDVIPEGSAMVSIECRLSVCRIEMVHNDLSKSQRFVNRAFRDPRTRLWKEPHFSAVRADSTDGRVVTISYLARDRSVAFVSSKK